MKCESLLSHVARLVERRAGSDASGQVGKRHAEIAVGVFVDQGYVLAHGARFSSIPACLSMLRSVPGGMSRLGCGYCYATRPGRMFELHVTSLLTDSPPAFS